MSKDSGNNAMLFGRKARGKDAESTHTAVDARAAASAAPAPAVAPSFFPASSPDEKAKQRMAAARHMSATFGEIVALLMRTPEYQSLSLRELETLVMPPLLGGQVSVATAQSKDTGVTVPVGAILWACVSADVATRLASHAGEPIRLSPAEWKSGEIIWVVASAGAGRVLSQMLKELSNRDWAGKDVRIVVRPKDGKPTVATLAVQSSNAA